MAESQPMAERKNLEAGRAELPTSMAYMDGRRHLRSTLEERGFKLK
ncbi:hypothetical protein [Serratia rubidaea]|nr:hypothetical protein [Serratia rubidaea]WBF47567.1 hypothetical protein OLD77_11150 [Serratia rubidaea]